MSECLTSIITKDTSHPGLTHALLDTQIFLLFQGNLCTVSMTYLSHCKTSGNMISRSRAEGASALPSRNRNHFLEAIGAAALGYYAENDADPILTRPTQSYTISVFQEPGFSHIITLIITSRRPLEYWQLRTFSSSITSQP